MLYYFWNKGFVFFFGVLFVEDAVFATSEAHASEGIFGLMALETIEQARTTGDTIVGEMYVEAAMSYGSAVADLFNPFAKGGDIHAILSTID